MGDFDFRRIISKLVSLQDLTEEEAAETYSALAEGRLTEGQVGALIIAERMKGASVSELTGFTKTMRRRAASKDHGFQLLDTCGTGADAIKTFNISTATIFILAAGGVKIGKHGVGAITSRSGSADVLAALGANIQLNIDQVVECIEKVGIGFAFVPRVHSTSEHVRKVRQEVGIGSLFNLIGPMSNPLLPSMQIMGVYSPEYAPKMAEVIARLGCQRGFVLYGEGGLDEASTLGCTYVWEIADGKVTESVIAPEQFGLKRARPEDLLCRDAKESARMIGEIFAGERGPRRDIVVLNAAFGFVAAGKAKDVKGGIALAEAEIDSGRAARKLEEFVAFTKSLPQS